ncbi:hypothetical protein VPH35_010435 [Triticum aestivum]
MAATPWLMLLFLSLGAGGVLQARAQPDSNGFISIDCGTQGKEGYVDTATKLLYYPDTGFTDGAGISRNISADYITPSLCKCLYTVRSFASGVRNCYTLRSLLPGLKYLIRAKFMYGNYDSLRRPPIFDLHIGVNYWQTVNITKPDTEKSVEAIVMVPNDFLQVCLINTGAGTPFISLLELRPLKKTMYPQVTAAQGLVLSDRINFGRTDENNEVIRYPDDPHDRIWTHLVEPTDISTTEKVTDSLFEVPTVVMQTAMRARIVSGGLGLRKGVMEPGCPGTRLSVIMAIKVKCQVHKNWFGDPCGPETIMVWDKLACSYATARAPRIRRVDLSSRGLNGGISSSFANLKVIQYLYVLSYGSALMSTALVQQKTIGKFFITHRNLSNNNLVGSIPDALSQLTSLTVLDWSHNQLNGVIPSRLVKGVQDGSLDLRYGNNRDLCPNGNSCGLPNKRKSNLTIYIAVPIVVLIIVVVLLLLFCLLRRKRQGSINNSVDPHNETMMRYVSGNDVHRDNSSLHRLESRQFTYEELKMITNNFQRVLGQGGFGYVYDGFQEDGTHVAVKLQSHSSSQGVKEFLAEAHILTRIHHKNLVTMIGYCKDGKYMALIYEYMSEGTLHEHIEGSKRDGGCLSWSQRLRIALESAQGLEYLHKGCNPPIIHRDIKATNILLNVRLEAKIADFGLSKAFNGGDDYASTMTLVGTPGYVDPEYLATMQPTTKSDVYNFGVVLLELVTGKTAILQEATPISIIHWTRKRMARGHIESVVDACMCGIYDVNSVWKMVEMALKCTAYVSPQRPTMTGVVAQLQECMELEEGSIYS